ncbi:MAG: hypothetical protein U9M98_01505 [Patescibacteria group bacterium]|nr:hypothetical protein [Patescibacteria group bacterium]
MAAWVTLVFPNGRQRRDEFNKARIQLSCEEESGPVELNFQRVIFVGSVNGFKIPASVIRHSEIDTFYGGEKEGAVTLRFDSAGDANDCLDRIQDFVEKYEYWRTLILFGAFEVVYVGGTTVDPQAVEEGEKVLV